MQDRTAARRHRVDAHHRRAHAHARHFRLEGALESAVIMRDIGRRAAHVEADDAVEPGRLAGLCQRNDAACRAGKNRILALKEVRRGQAAGGHHEHQPDAGARDIQLVRHLLHVARENRREIGIDHGGVAAPDELHQRGNLVAHRNLREPHRAGQFGDLLFVRGVAIGVHENDGDRLDPLRL